jgi:hypothetical protein
LTDTKFVSLNLIEPYVPAAKGFSDGFDEPDLPDRFHQVIECALFHSIDGNLKVRERGEHDDGEYIEVKAAEEVTEKPQSLFAGHLL